MMTLFGKSSNKSIDFKARLEHKLYLARENPDPIFDLSDCDLKVVPSGVYSLCKVFRKEALFLQNNNLTLLSGGGSFDDLSLLKILDLGSNHFNHLPQEIGHLQNLEELYLNNNHLKTLPETICSLTNLKVLSVSFNKLKRLPEGIGVLIHLRSLSLQGNPSLCTLPNSLCKATKLEELILDPGRLTHPPDDIVHEGTRAVLTYLAQQIGEEFTTTHLLTHDTEPEIQKGISSVQHKDSILQVKLEKLKKQKDEKIQERLAVERELSEQKEKEYQLHNIIKVGKDKLMEDLVRQQSKIAQEVVQFQNKRDAERSKLIEQIQKVEEEADQVIKQMLTLNNSDRDPSVIFHEQEMDRLAQETLFAKQSEELRRKEVLIAMESLLEEERVQMEKMKEYEKLKARVVQDTLNREEEWEAEVRRLIEESGSRSRTVAEALSAGCAAQTLAVATLLKRTDSQSRELTARLVVIEKQLAALTRIELDRAKLNNYQLQCDLSEKRTALSNLLVEVLNEQQERKNKLLSTLRKMERYRLEELEGKESEDFWLIQYQRLLELRPGGVQMVDFDGKLVYQLMSFGVIHCLPLLTRIQDIGSLDDAQLVQIGVIREEDRNGILKAVSAYYEEISPSPSAPPLDTPSAPPSDFECIICMESQCEVVFVPCGHLCSCIVCSERLFSCPLCRGNIERRIKVIPT